MTARPAALLVDYGGVLTERMDLIHGRFCQEAGIDPVSLEQVLDEWVRRPDGRGPVPAMERGELSVAAFERLLAGRLRRLDRTPVAAAGLLRGLFAVGRLDEQTLSLVAEVRAEGVRTVLVSNAWGSDYPIERLRGCIDELVFSNEIGARKPDPEIYLHGARLAGAAPASCLFVDDRIENVAGAIRVGMMGLHFAEPTAGRARLRELFRTRVPAAEGHDSA